LQLPWYSRIPFRLANGSLASMNVYSAKIIWDGKEEDVPVLEVGMRPLLGTALLSGFRLTAEFVEDGVVKLEKV
jgi:predicted aspartyl protease